MKTNLYAPIALAVATALAACGSDTGTPAEPAVSFKSVATPTTDADKRLAVASDTITVDGKSTAIGFHTLFRSGDVVGGTTWGQVIDMNGNALPNYSAAALANGVSASPDHTSLLQRDGKVFTITQFEDGAGMMYLSELSQDATTGALTPVASKPVDLSGTYGGYTFCAGMPTPWGSHLGGEEYPTNANAFEKNANVDPYFDPYLEYFGLDPADKAGTRAAAYAKTSVYRIGYPVEVKLTGTSLGSGPYAANAKATKHYAMGRLAWELAYVMPNQKAVYAGDDGTNRGMFRFVADTAGDLSSGRLYAAKLTQTSADNGGSFDIGWIDLGHASSSEIDQYIKRGVVFSDLFSETAAVSNACPDGFKPSEADGALECLALQTTNRLGMTAAEIETAASRLETLRLAAIRGATHEFRKFEGITYDDSRKKLYIAISDIGKAMTKAPTLAGLTDDIHVTANACGGVYQLDVDSDGVTKKMSALVLGIPKDYSADPTLSANSCDVDGIASPDNVVMGPTNDVLFIGEDTDAHQNDALWAYDLNTKALTRIFTTPYGSETTSPFYYRNINGFDYMTLVVQHPYGESDTDKVTDAADQKRAYVGYIGPLPVVKK